MIHLRDITLHFGARTLLDGVDLTIRPGEKIGLIGRNGSGKTTLLRLLNGQMKPDGGSIDFASNTQIGYLAQTVDFDLTQTPVEVCSKAFTELAEIDVQITEIQNRLDASTDAEEQLSLAGSLSALYERQSLLGSADQAGEIERVLKGMGFKDHELDNPLQTFSGGWRMRVELSRLLLLRPDLLLLDEPTNHLDIESILWLEKYLADYPSTVIIVSHDQYFLDRVTKRTLEIEWEQVQDYPYPYLLAMEKKVEMRAIHESAYRNQQRVIAHKERLIEKFRAKASKAKFAKALQTELARMDLVQATEENEKAIRLTFTEGQKSGKVAFRIEGLKKSFGSKHVITGLDLSIDRGTRIAFVGQNGRGKTTLARIMAGVLDADGGILEAGHNVTIGYYAQDQPDRIEPRRTVIDTLRDAAPQETEGRLRNVLGSLLFSGEDADKKCSVLSGGERARLTFACMMLTPSNVLILDEPTNHLDIQSKEILKQALATYAGTLIVVSHDVHFLSGLTKQTLEFRNGHIKLHLATISEYLELRNLESLREAEMSAPVHKNDNTPVKDTSDSRNEKRELQRRIQKLEREIEKLEVRKSGLESEMAATDFYFRDDVHEKSEEYRVLCDTLESKTRAWEELVDSVERNM